MAFPGNLDCDFGFTGHFTHEASGLVLTLYRAYDAETGRWLSRDPIGEEGGINLYGYVSNDPVNLWDPYGLWQFTLTGGYFLAGRITFGQNDGKWNFGAGLGLGLGIKGDFSPEDIDPNKPSNADPCASMYASIKFGVSGGLGAGPLGRTSGELSVSSRMDDLDNVHGALSGTLSLAEPIGGNRLGGTINANLYGCGQTGSYSADTTVGSSGSAGAGGVIFFGTTFGVSR